MENFLIDENLSPRIAIKLRSFGYSAKTIKDINLIGADDIQIVERAIKTMRSLSQGIWISESMVLVLSRNYRDIFLLTFSTAPIISKYF